MPDLVKTKPHICFEVDDLDRALEGREILIAPTSPTPELRVAFITFDGAPKWQIARGVLGNCDLFVSERNSIAHDSGGRKARDNARATRDRSHGV